MTDNLLDRIKARLREEVTVMTYSDSSQLVFVAWDTAERILDEEFGGLRASHARLIAAYKTYVALLTADLGDSAWIAISHGFQSSRVEAGKAARAEIAAAEAPQEPQGEEARG